MKEYNDYELIEWLEKEMNKNKLFYFTTFKESENIYCWFKCDETIFCTFHKKAIKELFKIMNKEEI